MRDGRHRERGFTLVEIMAVIILLGIIAVAVGRTVMGQFTGAKIKAARTQLSTLRQQVELFYFYENRYPKEEEGLAILTQPSPSLGNRPYVEEDQIRDPWGHPILYTIPGPSGKDFDLVSLGSDGRRGGTGDAADLSVWDKPADQTRQ